jgi:hypothetical protein
VIYGPGNHEFYHHEIAMDKELNAQAPDNIHILDDDQVIINDVVFLVDVSCVPNHRPTTYMTKPLVRRGDARFDRRPVSLFQLISS